MEDQLKIHIYSIEFDTFILNFCSQWNQFDYLSSIKRTQTILIEAKGGEFTVHTIAEGERG